jgi:hypothetical protein
MTHPEMDELLDLVRDGAAADDGVRQHVDDCAQCADGMQWAVRLDAAAARIGGDTQLVSPPPAVWGRIEAELAPAGPSLVPRTSVARRSRRRSVLVAAAALTGVVLGGVGGYVLADRGGSSSDRPLASAGTPVAAGTLDPVGQDVGSGRLVMSRLDGARSLTITFARTVTGPGYVEAWLLDPLTDEMLALGIVGPGGGTVTVPPDADLSRFTTVDISREPFDGDPAHSAESLSRGVLRGA